MTIFKQTVFFSIFALVLAQDDENIKLSSLSCNPMKDDCSQIGCSDEAPPGMTLSCAQIATNGLCSIDSITQGNFCQQSCGTCDGDTSTCFTTKFGCDCLGNWEYQSKNYSGCANPDQDNFGSWCQIVPGTCSQLDSNSENRPKFYDYCNEDCTASTPLPPPTIASTVSSVAIAGSSECSIYDSRLSVEYDVYSRCKLAAQSKSPTAVAACDLARDLLDLFATCQNRATFYFNLTNLSQEIIKLYDNPNEWRIRGLGVALEPYTFEGRPIFSYTNLPIDDEQRELNYDYYTECSSEVFSGVGCTWYNEAKLQTYYQELGGVWLVKYDAYVDGKFTILEAFQTPIIFQGRFFGVVFVDVLHD